jgi:sigma-54-interacting transcriptional regulator
VHLPGAPHVQFTTDPEETAGATPAGDFRRLFSVGSNMLVRGEKSAATATVVALSADLSMPVVIWLAGADADLPALDQGTVVLQDVDRLDLSAQHRLLSWLDNRSGRIRVISTARHDLFDLVTAGAFLDPLYYRLNTIVVDAVAPDVHCTPQ